MHTKSWFIGRVFVAALASIVTTKSTAAQAGSTGGTIGKTDKSVSGDEDRTAQPPKSRRNAKGSACEKAVGTWSWFDGGTAIIKRDGTATGGTVTANWSCINGQVVVTWSNGYNDRLSISADGNHLEGTNGIIRVFGDRK